MIFSRAAIRFAKVLANLIVFAVSDFACCTAGEALSRKGRGSNEVRRANLAFAHAASRPSS
jgi:hypothetical protein